MRRARLMALTAAAAMLGALVACSADESAPAPAAPGAASGSTGSGGSGPEDPLAAALSKPVEDSVYPDVGDPSVDALHYDLSLQWDPDHHRLTGEERLTLRSTATSDRLQLDLAGPLEVSKVLVDGGKTRFEHDGKNLVVVHDVVADQRYELTISYSGMPEPVPAPTTRRDFSTTGFTVAPDGSAWTMQEPYGAYTWYAVNDQPADKAFYDFTLSTPTPMVGVANGSLQRKDETDGTTVTDWHLDSPTSSYLVTLAFGRYEVTSDESDRGVPLAYWLPASSSQYLDEMQYTPDALAWVEDKLGAYPWSSLGMLVVDSNSGMETQSMITLGNTLYTTGKAVIVHEIVHQWYGDEVTPSDWSDLWMNEGMAMYLQFCWQAEDTGTPLHQILQQTVPTERRSRRESGPPAAYDPRTFAEIEVYYGPALMWDEVRRRIGDEKFWDMVRTWPTVDPDGSSNRHDYLAWVEDYTGAELSDLFDGWLLAKRSPHFS